MTSKKNISIPASKSTELTDATATQVSTTPKNDKTMISDNSNNSTLAVNNDNADNNTTATTLFAEESASTVQPKQLRIGKQQRKLDYAEFKATYLTPAKLMKRHPVNIEDSIWAKLERIARILGERDTTVGSYINAVLLEHLNLYADDIEIWRKL
ncbi:DUF3408 domain-containing protein [Muribaculum intestinale]|uniref:DUF3408 domain-containing protein n=2 Tax=Muribaculum intestinale TaxID=1796646 RepID=UPI0025A9FE7C|nr:DUF3408 domain-containing protein [Muribaculum intestinale]